MKLNTYKLEPIVTKLYCDCGGEMRDNTEIITLFTNTLKNKPEYSYKCSKCGKELISTINYHLNEERYRLAQVIEEIELEENENDR